MGSLRLKRAHLGLIGAQNVSPNKKTAQWGSKSTHWGSKWLSVFKGSKVLTGTQNVSVGLKKGSLGVQMAHKKMVGSHWDSKLFLRVKSAQSSPNQKKVWAPRIQNGSMTLKKVSTGFNEAQKVSLSNQKLSGLSKCSLRLKRSDQGALGLSRAQNGSMALKKVSPGFTEAQKVSLGHQKLQIFFRAKIGSLELTRAHWG